MNDMPPFASTGKTKRSAFTLIELLSVIAVIGVLTAILIPALSGVREKGKQVQCASNLRQLQAASMLYANDQGIYLPYTINAGSSGGKVTGRTFWYQNPDFLAYLGGDKDSGSLVRKTMICPTRGDIQSTSSDYVGGYSYGMNIQNIPGGWSTVGESGVNPVKLERPAEKMAFADGADMFILMYASKAYVQEQYYQHAIAYRHNGKANVVHFDGSVSTLAKEDIVANVDLWDLSRR
ncbi:prepilin-type N-terminal cleavage/methylation domain-containing protein [Coraliomargarita parva]|uniref:prepilin-type N-terminal cleavage/methylation domain-containing protein n=1 Tax=Coraliomargarita parva TaxID=3014050 RepID=UPI0022B2C5AA|nr:prepilin-type N-terminal cleavage/methylation domain-containing protein [Coraliomargarita parva]